MCQVTLTIVHSWVTIVGMGPLHGVKILEIGSIGPGPFAGTLLAGMGADVLRLHRAGERSPVALAGSGADHEGRPGLAVDLKSDAGRELVCRLAASADALIEGFRPGVMERLGLGPDDLAAHNPALVYGRITGYGQHGPLAEVPGHDINYLAMSGVLSALGRSGERPLFPINLLGDYGGGGMLLAFGVLAGIVEARVSGRGQVVDAAMVDGVAQLATIIFSFAGAGSWGAAGTNVLDSGAHFYDVYETADGRHVAVGAIEPQFYAELLRLLELAPEDFPQWDRELWPQLRKQLADVFATRTRDEWAALFEHADACVTPVLSLAEAPDHPHNVARETFVDRAGRAMPSPAPRFSRTPSDAALPCADPASALRAWGLPDEQITAAAAAGAF
jgi:alpha-methylacyl-CoA racemase